jgi:predicted permease
MNAPTFLRELTLDVADAVRSLRRAPGFALFTAFVIAVGVGAGTAVFSVLKPLVIAPLPFRDADALVWISNSRDPNERSLSSTTSRSSNLRDFRERAGSFTGLTGYNAFSDQAAYNLTGSGEPERLVGFGVAHDFLELLGIQPLLGRGFTPEEGAWGGPRAVILSNGFWRRRFAAEPGIVGRTLTLNDEPRTVVGVLPPDFDFAAVFTPGARVDFLLPYAISDETDRHGNEIVILGRMRDGITPGAAQADLDGVIAQLRAEQPERWGLNATLTPLRARLAGPFRPVLFLLAAAAGTLILLVCVNVSNLLLARSPGRARDVAIRKALGAPRGRLARGLVLESLLISLAGAVGGGTLAWAATRAVSGTAGLRIPLLDHVRVDGWALLFAASVALITGLVVSLVPAFQVTEGGEATVLRAGGRTGTSTREARRMREVLVVAEVTLACVLLVVGGLLVRSFRAVLDVDLGFDPRGAVAWQLNPSRDFASNAEQSDFFNALTDRVAQVPGVEGVGLIDALPLGRNRGWGFRVEGVSYEEGDGVGFFPHLVDAGYLGAMRIPVVSGRGFTRDDAAESQQVVLINETTAERIFPGQDPLGRKILLWQEEGWEIVGVVRDVRHLSPEAGAGIQVYLPASQMPDFQTLDMVVRSSLPTQRIAVAVSAALREVDASMPTREFWTLDSTVDRAVSARRFTLRILSAFGGAALLLAGLGLYGVLAQSVAERRGEIGIRMALGASAVGIVRDVMVRTLVLAGVGIAAGALASLSAGTLLSTLLYGVDANDPAAFGGMALVLLVVACVASALPAARAARTRGTQALRAE